MELNGSNFSESDLYRADLGLSFAQDANFSYASMIAANMYFLDLENANLQGTQLQFANMEGICLAHARLDGANLQGTDLSVLHHLISQPVVYCSRYFTSSVSVDNKKIPIPANLSDAILTSANLSGANLSGADLREPISVVPSLRCQSLRCGSDLCRSHRGKSESRNSFPGTISEGKIAAWHDDAQWVKTSIALPCVTEALTFCVFRREHATREQLGNSVCQLRKRRSECKAQEKMGAGTLRTGIFSRRSQVSLFPDQVRLFQPGYQLCIDLSY